VRGFLCRKQICTTTVCDTPLDGQPSVDSTSSSRHRSIAGYRPTIVLIAAGRSSVHNMRWSQILSQNPDFSLPHVHSVPSEYCYNVWYGKIRMVWLPGGENNLKIYLFVLTECSNVTDIRADRRTDTVWRLRPCLHSIAQQKNGNKTAKINVITFHEYICPVCQSLLCH